MEKHLIFLCCDETFQQEKTFLKNFLREKIKGVGEDAIIKKHYILPAVIPLTKFTNYALFISVATIITGLLKGEITFCKLDYKERIKKDKENIESVIKNFCYVIVVCNINDKNYIEKLCLALILNVNFHIIDFFDVRRKKEDECFQEELDHE